MSTYTVTVTREADAWLAQCDQEPTAHTWAPLWSHCVTRSLMSSSWPPICPTTPSLMCA